MSNDDNNFEDIVRQLTVTLLIVAGTAICILGGCLYGIVKLFQFF